MNPIRWYEGQGWYITSPYGNRNIIVNGVRKNSFHNGTDLGGGGGCNAPVRTPYGGRVRLATGNGMGTWGRTVVIEIAPGLLQLNAHLNSINVKAGEVVRQGDIIGLNGGTNNTSKPYPCHIHYEIRIDDGSRVVGVKPWGDPEKFYLEQFDPPVSNKFKAGDKVLTTVTLNVRPEPGLAKPPISRYDKSSAIYILPHADNGIYRDGFSWWLVDGGWVAEDFIKLIEEFKPPEIKEPETEYPEITMPEIKEPEKEEVEIPGGLINLLRQLYKLLEQMFSVKN